MKHTHHNKVLSATPKIIQKSIVAILVVSTFLLQPLYHGGIAQAANATPLPAPVATGAQSAQSTASTATTGLLRDVVGGTRSAVTNAAVSAIRTAVPAPSASSGIVGKCVGQVLQQQAVAFVAQAAITAIGVAAAGLEVALAVPVGTASATAAGSAGAGEGAAATVMSWIKPMTDCVVHEMTQLMIDSLNTAVNNAISQGNYAAGTNQFMANLVGLASGALRNQINGLALCDFTGGNSFRNGLSNSIANSSYSPFSRQVECPFPTTGTATARAFYGDFTSGGWKGFETSLQDSGNPFGVTVATAEKLASDQAATNALAEQQLAQGNGYRPVVDTTNCNYPEGYEAALNTLTPDKVAAAQSLYCKVITPGSTVAATAEKTATSFWERINISGAAGKPMDGADTTEVTTGLTNI